ncbi:hypothetical protein KUCAC02_031946, partial [Chaenocephalus aceratus]
RGSGSGVRHSVSSTHWSPHQSKNLQMTYNGCAYSAYALRHPSSVLPKSSTNELALEALRNMGVGKVEDLKYVNEADLKN